MPAVEHLAGQLRFAPPEALLRAVERVEELAAEIDGEAEYPADWVVFRVTGYRSDRATEAMSPIRGTVLLADLSPLAERLSHGAKVPIGEARRAGMLGVEDLCARWRVSRKTIDRLRRRGLIARRALDARGRASLVFAPAVVEKFEAAHAEALSGAGAFTRIDPDTEERMVRRAARYRRMFDWSLSTAAARIAEHFGRSHEAVRALLLRQGPALSLPSRPRVARDSGRETLRAMSRGAEPRTIAARTGVTARGVARAAALSRRELLRDLLDAGDLTTSRSPTFDHPAADEVILAPAPVRTGLGGPANTDLLALLRAARERDPRPPNEERARALAYHYLRFRAAGVIGTLDAQHPSATDLDRVETWLRWSARLKAELMRPQLHLVVETLEGLLGGPPEELPLGLHSAQLVSLVRAALAALGEAVDQFEPQRPARVPAGRLAAAAGMALARACTRWMRSHGLEGAERPAKRAASRLLEGVVIPDWTLSCAPWQTWLEPDARVRAALAGLDAGEREVLAERFGWTGGPPRTLAEIAAARRTTVIRAAVMERRALRAAFAWARAAPEPGA